MRFDEFNITEAFDTDITKLQIELKAAGADLGRFGPKGDGIDGKIGPLTQRAMLKFPKIAAKYKDTADAAAARDAFAATDSRRVKVGQNTNIDNATRDRARASVQDLDKKNSGSIMPVNGRVTSPFGPRQSPVPGASTNHLGTDLSAPTGTPVRSPISGKVVYAKMDDNPCGGTIAIKNNNKNTP